MNPKKSWLPVVMCLCAAVAGAAEAQPESRPNIILIFTDDQGLTDLSIHGFDDDVRTPQIDQLARDGVLFTRGYVTAPQCVPSRAGLLTGRHQNAFHMETNHDGPLPLSEPTIADRLQRAGYATGMVGKWHLGPVPRSQHPQWDGESYEPYLPRNRGFEDYWYGSINNYEVNYRLDGTDMPGAPAKVTDTRFRVDVQTEAALAFLQRRKDDDRPFFLYLAWFAPHAPMQAPPHHMERLPHVQQHERRMGLASILAMDDGVGLIRKKLEEMGQTENTLIFYISDNGAPLRQRAYVGSLNAPAVGEKGMQTDGGQRVPFVAAWPGRIPAGQVFDQAVWSLDATVTSLAATGAPMDGEFDGVDLMPWLTNERSGQVHDALYWRWRSQATILEGDWKFIRLGDRARYLFDMRELGKQTAGDNQIGQHPTLAARLEEKLKQKADTWQPPGLPTEVVAADQLFFDVHVDQTLPATHPDPRLVADPTRIIRPEDVPAVRSQTPYPADEMQGWVVRQGMALRSADGVLRIMPVAKDATGCFLTIVPVDWQPPVTLEIEAKSPQPVRLTATWRTVASGRDFIDSPATALGIPGGDRWQVVKTEIPADDRVIHLRISLPRGHVASLEVRRIVIQGGSGASRAFSF